MRFLVELDVNPVLSDPFLGTFLVGDGRLRSAWARHLPFVLFGDCDLWVVCPTNHRRSPPSDVPKGSVTFHTARLRTKVGASSHTGRNRPPARRFGASPSPRGEGEGDGNVTSSLPDTRAEARYPTLRRDARC
jgi:hypothetical protein